MSNLNQKTVLNAFSPYFRVIDAYNSKHFQHHDWRRLIFSGFCALRITSFVILLSTYIIFCAWYLLENDSDIIEILVSIPILASLLQMELTLVALVMENGTISETMDRLQRVVDQRKIFPQPFYRKLRDLGRKLEGFQEK